MKDSSKLKYEIIIFNNFKLNNIKVIDYCYLYNDQKSEQKRTKGKRRKKGKRNKKESEIVIDVMLQSLLQCKKIILSMKPETKPD